MVTVWSALVVRISWLICMSVFMAIADMPYGQNGEGK